MRKYKGKTLDLLKKITAELQRDITEPEAKAAFLYIVGEFCMNIPKSTEYISPYITNFADEPPVVKLQILNAIIKNYVNKPDDESENLVKSALKKLGVNVTQQQQQTATNNIIEKKHQIKQINVYLVHQLIPLRHTYITLHQA